MQKILLTIVISTMPISAFSAGFGLAEQSGSGLGNAFAGAAAAEDASTIFFNPAGMTYIQNSQLVGAMHLIKPSIEFNNEGSVAGFGKPLGSDGNDAGSLALVPNFYYATDLADNIKIGIGVNAPFGLKTDYDKNWMGRFQAIKSQLKTININPAIALKVNDQLSLGFGISAMWADAELTNAVNFGSAGEGFSTVKGDDWGFGFNLGAIYQATTDTRIGVAYRSKVEQHLEGDAKFDRPVPALIALAPDGHIKADLTLPETFSVNAFSRLNDKWDLMGDVTWTRWSQFKELAIYRDNGAALNITPENWDNTMRYSVGMSYHFSDALTFRAGLAYDEGPVSDEVRTARIPDNDRKWFALGAAWQVTPHSKFDIGYAHIFINDPNIDENLGLAKGHLKGNYDGKVDVVSMQITHNF